MTLFKPNFNFTPEIRPNKFSESLEIANLKLLKRSNS